MKNSVIDSKSTYNSQNLKVQDLRGRLNSTRFCKYCRVNGHLIYVYSKKQIEVEVKIRCKNNSPL